MDPVEHCSGGRSPVAAEAKHSCPGEPRDDSTAIDASRCVGERLGENIASVRCETEVAGMIDPRVDRRTTVAGSSTGSCAGDRKDRVCRGRRGRGRGRRRGRVRDTAAEDKDERASERQRC